MRKEWQLNNNRVLKLNGKIFAFTEPDPPVPSTCTDEQPELLLTVTGGTGTVTWGGESWTEGQRGQTRTVCPILYVNGQTNYTTGSNTIKLGEFRVKWPNNGIYMIRKEFYQWYYGSLSWNSQANWLELNANVPGAVFARNRKYWTRDKVAPNYIRSNIMNWDNVERPSYSDYQITDDYFGSYVYGGITYTWAKGNGWD